MALPGQRFHIDLDVKEPSIPAGINVGLVGEIKERTNASNPRPPSPPRFKSSRTGFPVHKTRTGSSKFCRKNEDERVVKESADKSDMPVTSDGTSVADGHDKAHPGIKDPSIDRENRQRLAEMSDQEIKEAREELMAGLNPSLIERLLKKASIDDGAEEAPSEEKVGGQNLARSRPSPEKFTPTESNMDSSTSTALYHNLSWDPEGPPLNPPQDLHPASSYPSSLPQPSPIHFPKPVQPPDLDPSDPDFLSTLHSTYYPNLPADPSTMAWMAPLDSKAEEESSYSPCKEALHVSAIRFNFRGQLLPPRLSSQIPSTKGLHHHAHAPSSAGYTIPELAHLARSSYPAQRCIAYQTLGRILYRLGRGDFGREGEDLCEGLWQQMEQGKVVNQLVEAAAKGDAGNKSIWATATEAVWLWRKGGGKRWLGR